MPLSGILFALATALCWALAPLFYRRNMAEELPFFKMNAMRSLGFLGFMVTAVLIMHPPHLMAAPGVIALIACGTIIGNVTGDLFYMSAIGATGVGRATGIASIYPLVVTTIAVIWLDERVTLPILTGTLAVIFGLNLLRNVKSVGMAGADLKKGFLLALGAALCWGTSFPVSRWVMVNTDLDYITLNFWRSCAFLPAIWAVWFVKSRTLKRPVPLFKARLVTWLEVMASGAIALAIAGLCLAAALDRAPASLVSPLTASSPLLATFLGMLLFKEEVSRRQWFGVACIVVGTVIIGR
ncbi:MAG: DMT family transporter [Synergistales bacterium]|nr:DMT family transporter [Synergistales bacterium]